MASKPSQIKAPSQSICEGCSSKGLQVVRKGYRWLGAFFVGFDFTPQRKLTSPPTPKYDNKNE